MASPGADRGLGALGGNSRLRQLDGGGSHWGAGRLERERVSPSPAGIHEPTEHERVAGGSAGASPRSGSAAIMDHSVLGDACQPDEAGLVQMAIGSRAAPDS